MVVVVPELERDLTDTITNPQLIVEVLSASPKGYDRSGKFETYCPIPTFTEYLLIDQIKIYVEQYSQTGNKHWSAEI